MQLEIGAIYDGKVNGLTKFGAFVTFDGDKTGMVHISEVSDAYVNEIKDVLSENQEVKVKVISMSEDGKIGLSIKQATEKKQRKNYNQKRKPPNVWQGEKSEEKKDLSFEDMLSKFKQVSDEKFTDLKRSKELKQGTNFSRGGRNR